LELAVAPPLRNTACAQISRKARAEACENLHALAAADGLVAMSSLTQTVLITQASTPEQFDQARELFLEYARSLGFSLCFQNFEQELKSLPGAYAAPSGRLLLAYDSDVAAGCVALRKLEDGICEMKRLYVRPNYRGKGIGKLLVDGVIAEARAIVYRQMRLDTIASSMQSAIALYRQMGFREIPAYCPNPMPEALYMELAL
jgi:ribosomal protein S18 acetylase RimI-like enzyme